jgi:hypothetical protein
VRPACPPPQQRSRAPQRASSRRPHQPIRARPAAGDGCRCWPSRRPCTGGRRKFLGRPTRSRNGPAAAAAASRDLPQCPLPPCRPGLDRLSGRPVTARTAHQTLWQTEVHRSRAVAAWRSPDGGYRCREARQAGTAAGRQAGRAHRSWPAAPGPTPQSPRPCATGPSSRPASAAEQPAPPRPWTRCSRRPQPGPLRDISLTSCGWWPDGSTRSRARWRWCGQRTVASPVVGGVALQVCYDPGRQRRLVPGEARGSPMLRP